MNTKFSILKVIAIFILTTTINAESFAQAPKPTANKSQESIAATIKALSTDWSTAMLKGDASILERIWATDFIYVEPNGKRFNKVEGIAGMKIVQKNLLLRLLAPLMFVFMVVEPLQ